MAAANQLKISLLLLSGGIFRDRNDPIDHRIFTYIFSCEVYTSPSSLDSQHQYVGKFITC